MMISLKDISWLVDEPTYRADPALSYSTLARYEREGFNKLSNLYDKLETPSLTFGSAVDALITGGQEEFDKNFFVASFPQISDSILKMVKEAFIQYKEKYNSIFDIPDKDLILLSNKLDYQKNWKPETRARVVKEQGAEYYSLLYLAKDKTIINSETKIQVDAAVDVLKKSPSTSWFFEENSPFSNVERFYQLKFKAKIYGVPYRCMMDLVIVDHDNKTIYPVDLKTSSHYEWDFFKSFIDWNYQIQARLYFRILKENLEAHPIYKDYKLADYTFIVVNKKTLTPLAWKFDDTDVIGDLKYNDSKGNLILLRDPFTIGTELYNYLAQKPKVPNGINLIGTNSLTEWFNRV